MHCPSEDHMDAVIRILRYLKSSPGKGSCSPRMIISKLRDTHTQIEQEIHLGYFMFVGGNLVTWRSKNHVLALSSAEAEFGGMTKGLCELL